MFYNGRWFYFSSLLEHSSLHFHLLYAFSFIAQHKLRFICVELSMKLNLSFPSLIHKLRLQTFHIWRSINTQRRATTMYIARVQKCDGMKIDCNYLNQNRENRTNEALFFCVWFLFPLVNWSCLSRMRLRCCHVPLKGNKLEAHGSIIRENARDNKFINFSISVDNEVETSHLQRRKTPETLRSILQRL